MKNKILTAILVVASLTSFSTVRTVSNHVLGGAQYSSLQAGYDASSNGDTLLVEGNVIEYNMDYFAKSLVVIGQGLNTQKQNFHQTIFGKASSGSGSSSSWVFNSGSSGSKFYGINFKTGSAWEMGMFIGQSDILFENCMFDRVVANYGSNVVFRNCIFILPGTLYLFNTVSNVLFSNCIFNGDLGGDLLYTQIVSIDHCIFLSSGACFVNCSGFEVSNCIFMNSTGVSGITSSDFQNNICRNSFTFPPAGNTDNGGNQTSADPLFVTYTANSSYSAAHDYHLQAGSPAIGTASDATDVGVHGGFTNFSESGEVLITPVIRNLKISNNTVPSNGTINVHVEGSKPNDD